MDHADQSRARSGRAFVIGAVTLLAALVAFLLLVSPNLQRRMGLGAEGIGFEEPDAPVSYELVGADGWQATATWTAAGVCVVVTDREGQDFRTCADPDPLRPIWALDAPDGPLLVVATTPEAARVVVTTTEGDVLEAPVQGGGRLPAEFAVLTLPSAEHRVDQVLVEGEAGEEMVVATCGEFELGGPALLGGGCEIPAE